MNNASSTNFGQWLWQSQEMKRHRAELQASTGPHDEFLEQARVAWAQAERLASEPPYNQRAHMPVLARRLYGESIYWSLTALFHRRGGFSPTFVPPPTIASAWEGAGAEMSGATLPTLNPQLSAWLCQLVPGKMLPPEPLEPVQEVELSNFARQLLEQADSAARGVERIWFNRAQRVGLPLLLSLVLLLAGRTYLDWSRISEETSFPWRASSSNGEPGCRSPRQGCEQDHFFFHTRLESAPWIEFDVSSLNTVSHVIVTNRTDCPDCSARAVPLVIEVADSDRNFRTIASRSADFSVWDVQFPRTPAHYLRLRSTRRTHLHLRQVRIQP